MNSPHCCYPNFFAVRYLGSEGRICHNFEKIILSAWLVGKFLESYAIIAVARQFGSKRGCFKLAERAPQNRFLTTALIAKNSLYGGARLETLLDAQTFSGNSDGTGLQFLPEIHGLADYALYLGSQLSKARGEMQLDLEALRWNSWMSSHLTGTSSSRHFSHCQLHRLIVFYGCL